jgi:hypothetical protein
MFRHIGDKFNAAFLRSSARVARKSHASQRHIAIVSAANLRSPAIARSSSGPLGGGAN